MKIMDSYEYEAIRKKYPELDFWPWRELETRLRRRVRRANAEQLIASRAKRILEDGHGFPWSGRREPLKPDWRKH
jgi:hypothetical protein